MRAKVGDVAHVPRWKYEYDYGTTTELRLRVGRAHVGPGGRPRMLARNVAPPWSCVECGAAATSICAVCNAGTDTWLCAECATKHACGEEYLLPAVNSPRVGQCGYTGD